MEEVGTFHLLYSHNREDQTSCSLKDPSLLQISFTLLLQETPKAFKEKQRQEKAAKEAGKHYLYIPTAFPGKDLQTRKNSIIQIKQQTPYREMTQLNLCRLEEMRVCHVSTQQNYPGVASTGHRNKTKPMGFSPTHLSRPLTSFIVKDYHGGDKSTTCSSPTQKRGLEEDSPSPAPQAKLIPETLAHRHTWL